MVVDGSSRSVVSLRYDCFITKDVDQTEKFRVDFQEWYINIDRLLKVIEVLQSCGLFFCIVHYTHLFTCANRFTFVKLICTFSCSYTSTVTVALNVMRD